VKSADGTTTVCAPCAIAKAWKSFENGKYAQDCVNQMSIALGEGIIPGSPLKYITEYCGSSCWAGPDGPPISQEAFIHHTSLFDLNMHPYDGQATLGPWQTMTAIGVTHDVNVRISEAVGYVESCCMDGTINVDVDAGSRSKWCTGGKSGNCENSVDGHCDNPFFPGSSAYPVSTIQKSTLSPPLTFCGCATEGSATVGYSGRCSHKMADFYTRYEALAQAVCDAA